MVCTGAELSAQTRGRTGGSTGRKEGDEPPPARRLPRALVLSASLSRRSWCKTRTGKPSPMSLSGAADRGTVPGDVCAASARNMFHYSALGLARHYTGPPCTARSRSNSRSAFPARPSSTTSLPSVAPVERSSSSRRRPALLEQVPRTLPAAWPGRGHRAAPASSAAYATAIGPDRNAFSLLGGRWCVHLTAG